MKAKRRRISIEFSEEEFQQIDKLRRETLLSFPGLVCHILLHRQFTVLTRNRSMDECMEELILLRRQLRDGTWEVGPQGLDMIAQIQEQIQKLSELWLQ